ncbi:hypothetical protein ACFXBB_36430 [Streptomyces scopuliridis]|uniref:hypothetical protein n=1 Tax=Streptomyces scopuliridis TaxID=452529 RepID=UPI00367C4F63
MSLLAYALLAVGAFHERQRAHLAEPEDHLVMVPVSPREPAGHTGAADTDIGQPTATAAGKTSRQWPSHDRNLTTHDLQLP